MSSSMNDLKEVHQAYTRLSEKFKTFWTFHQFLQGVHKAFLGDAPGYAVDFQGLYDQIRGITEAMSFQPPVQVLDTIQRLDLQLDAVYQKIAADDGKIAPSYVRRFFERVRTEDEKLLLSLLRFYFYSRHLDADALDKVDFLLTHVGARVSLDDGRFLARFPQELQKLFGGLLGLSTRRDATTPEGRAAAVARLQGLRREIEACGRFEDLTEKRHLDRLRELKHALGASFFEIDVLSAILETNLAAKNKFHRLWEDEEKRILDSSRQILEMEKELAASPDETLQEQFRRFHEFRQAFEKNQKEGGVRHHEVARLAESIEKLFTRLDRSIPGSTVSTVQTSSGPISLPEAPTSGVFAAPSPEELAPRVEEKAAGPANALTADPLVGEWVHKVLYSIELIDDGTGSGKAAWGGALAGLRLEPWEVRAARRLQGDEMPTEEGARRRDLLYLEAAALRLRIDEEARWFRTAAAGDPEASEAAEERLWRCGACLVRAQEIDRRFRAAVEEAALSAPPERLNELHRSRFRLLRGFSGLWLIHNQRAERPV